MSLWELQVGEMTQYRKIKYPSTDVWSGYFPWFEQNGKITQARQIVLRLKPRLEAKNHSRLSKIWRSFLVLQRSTEKLVGTFNLLITFDLRDLIT